MSFSVFKQHFSVFQFLLGGSEMEFEDAGAVEAQGSFPWRHCVLFLMNEIAVTRLSDEGKNNYMLYIDYVRSENG